MTNDELLNLQWLQRRQSTRIVSILGLENFLLFHLNEVFFILYIQRVFLSYNPLWISIRNHVKSFLYEWTFHDKRANYRNYQKWYNPNQFWSTIIPRPCYKHKNLPGIFKSLFLESRNNGLPRNLQIYTIHHKTNYSHILFFEVE